MSRVEKCSSFPPSPSLPPAKNILLPAVTAEISALRTLSVAVDHVFVTTSKMSTLEDPYVAGLPEREAPANTILFPAEATATPVAGSESLPNGTRLALITALLASAQFDTIVAGLTVTFTVSFEESPPA